MTQPTDLIHDADVAQSILRAAIHLFAEKGFRATSVREIVEEAGVTKPALYYWYKSKEGLGEAIFRTTLDELDRRLDAIDPSSRGEERLYEFIAAHFRFASDEPERARALFALYWGPSTETAFLDLQNHDRNWFERINAIVKELVSSGLVAEDDREVSSRAIAGMINISVIQHVRLGVDISDASARRAAHFLARSAGGRSAEAN
jgi:AcrR family transcriptional regulator